MRRITILIISAVTILLSAPAFIALPPADAAVSCPGLIDPPQGAAPACDNNGAGLALDDNEGKSAVGNLIEMRTPQLVPAENISSSSQYGDNGCPAVSGFLSCPFLNATWDNTYDGDGVIELNFGAIGSGSECVGLDSSDEVILQSCTASPNDGGKEYWVVAEDKAGDQYLINVWATNVAYRNGNHNVQALTGSGTKGIQASTENWDANQYQLWESGGW